MCCVQHYYLFVTSKYARREWIVISLYHNTTIFRRQVHFEATDQVMAATRVTVNPIRVRPTRLAIDRSAVIVGYKEQATTVV